MSRKRPRSVSPSAPDVPRPNHQTCRSGAIKDRSSTFVALFSSTAPTKHLQAQPDFKTATHRIAAWRKPSAQRALFSSAQHLLFDTGYDDDGEQYAGKRLGKVLKELNVEGAVVVARWYGGILLGPVRFTHIENCAREAIEKWKMSTAAREPADYPALQKRKALEGEGEGEEENRRSTLAKVLEERDHNISALRGLLREKTGEASTGKADEEPSGTRDASVTPTKPVNYSAMPLQALERFEKARDATISWILKEIEKVEEQQ